MYKRIVIFFSIILSLCFLSSCNNGGSSQENREITDMAQRKVIVPQKIDKAFSTIASGTMIIYSIEPDLLIGVNYAFNDEEKAFIPQKYHDLPSYGQQGKGLNSEAIIAAAPDVIITYDNMTETDKKYANELQAQTGIPVVMVDGSLENVADAYRFLGNLFGLQDKTELLASFAEDALSFANGLVENQTTIFYGNGIDSLETVPVGSSHAELFELVKVDNVVKNQGEVKTRITISSEQIIAWDPEVVILNGEPDVSLSSIEAITEFMGNEKYKNLSAVRNNRVYAIPKYPYSWFDRPQSANRLIGIYWLADIIYPERDIDLTKLTRDFYSLFYHFDLSNEDMDSLLGA